MITLDHPDTMPLERLEEAYGLTEGTTDFEIQGWRSLAYHSLKGRTGRCPAPPLVPPVRDPHPRWQLTLNDRPWR